MRPPSKRLLVATRHPPLPGFDGAADYLFDLLSYFKERGVQIDIAWLGPQQQIIDRGWWTVPKRLADVATVHLPDTWAIGRLRIFPKSLWLPLQARALYRIKRTLQLVGLMRRKARSAPPPKAHFPTSPRESNRAKWRSLPSQAERAFFRSVANAVRPTSILANYCWLTPLFAEFPHARKSVLTHDVASHRFAMLDLDLSPSSALDPGTPEGESALLGMADTLLAISADDVNVFRAMQPGSDVLLVPKAAVPQPTSGQSIAGRCLFVGGDNLPNREGLQWFLHKVWPLVLQQEHAAHLHVVGAAGKAVSSQPHVKLCGRVEELNLEYAAAQVVVVPLLRGTGVKIKLVEAASFGKACVTTPVGLQGLPFFQDGVIVAQEPAEFAEAIVRILSSDAVQQQLGTRLLAAVEDHLSPDTCYGEVYAKLVGTSNQAPRSALAPAAA